MQSHTLEWASTLISLLALASRLEDEGHYNLAKLARAAADAMGRRAAYEAVRAAEWQDLAGEIEQVTEAVSRLGLSEELTAALRRGANALAGNRIPSISETPHPFVCRTCGHLVVGAVEETCPTCGAWPDTFQWFAPNYWFEALDPPAALETLRRTPPQVAALLGGLSEEAMTRELGDGGWALRNVVQHLRDGRHVVVQFGGYDDLRDYMLVTNLLTRRIHAQYRDMANERRAGTRRDTSRSLVVVLEEAHKFLSPAAARQSIFGTIAREMRKFDVSLMVVDQRPSQIDSEVMSQLATRISGLLTDEHDIAAVLSGTGDRPSLRSMLASLEPSRQCLVVGHAIPMPMVVRTREYGRALRDDVRRKGPDDSLGIGLLTGGRSRGAH